MMIVEWSETKLSLSMDNYSLDAPYGDSFMVKEEWLVLSQQPYDRCVLRISMQIHWFKSTIFKGKITSKAEVAIQENTNEWISLVR